MPIKVLDILLQFEKVEELDGVNGLSLDEFLFNFAMYSSKVSLPSSPYMPSFVS